MAALLLPNLRYRMWHYIPAQNAGATVDILNLLLHLKKKEVNVFNTSSPVTLIWLALLKGAPYWQGKVDTQKKGSVQMQMSE